MGMTATIRCRQILELLMDPACLASLEMGLLLLWSLTAGGRKSAEPDDVWNPHLTREASRQQDDVLYFHV